MYLEVLLNTFGVFFQSAFKDFRLNNSCLLNRQWPSATFIAKTQILKKSSPLFFRVFLKSRVLEVWKCRAAVFPPHPVRDEIRAREDRHILPLWNPPCAGINVVYSSSINDADLNALWKLPNRLCIFIMVHILQNGPYRQTRLDRTAAEWEQSVASGPGVVPTLPLLITESPQHGTKHA